MSERQVGDVGTGDGPAQANQLPKDPGLWGCLAVPGVIAAIFVVGFFVQPLLGGLLYQGLALHKAPDWYDLAPQYWLFVAVGALPGLLGQVTILLSAHPTGPRSKSITWGVVGFGWTFLWVISMFGGRTTDVSIGDVSIKFGVSLSGAEFLRDAAEPAGAVLPFFVIDYLLMWWLMTRPVRLPRRAAVAGAVSVAAVVAVVLVGRAVGSTYL